MVVGFQSEFFYAEKLEARLMVISAPVEGVGCTAANFLLSIKRILLVRKEGRIIRNYCAFWKKARGKNLVQKLQRCIIFSYSYASKEKLMLCMPSFIIRKDGFEVSGRKGDLKNGTD